jgi:S1-C subfamily serine protease
MQTISVISGFVIGHASLLPFHSLPSDVYKRSAPSVVTVTTLDLVRDPFSPNSFMESKKSTGTGFSYKGKNGKNYIITNSHVVSDAFNVSITTFDKQEIPVEVINNDHQHDIAILEMQENEKVIPSLHKCTSPVVPGAPVLAIGNPFGFDHSISSGIISGTGRAIDSQNSLLPLVDLLQTDASINPGNSGGPLLDASSGCVLGMNTLIMSPTGVNIGLGFAVPMNVIEDTLDASLSHIEGVDREDVQLGVTVLPDVFAEMLNVHGVIIANVIPGGMADSIGLIGTYRDETGRPFVADVIVGINDQIIKKKTDLYRILHTLKNDDTFQLDVLKNDGIHSFSIKCTHHLMQDQL